MHNITKGDIIFHSFHRKPIAVSITQTNAYSAPQPAELKAQNLWEENGIRADCSYTVLHTPLCINEMIDTILDLQPSKYAPFNRLGKGNTGYLFDCTPKMAEFLFDKINQILQNQPLLANILQKG